LAQTAILRPVPSYYPDQSMTCLGRLSVCRQFLQGSPLQRGALAPLGLARFSAPVRAPDPKAGGKSVVRDGSSPYHGRGSVEGEVLPVASSHAAASNSMDQETEELLRSGLCLKKSSVALGSQQQTTDGHCSESMFRPIPADLAQEHASRADQPYKNMDHLENIQAVLRRLRGRTIDPTDARDVSNTMMQALRYAEKRRKAGGGSGGS